MHADVTACLNIDIRYKLEKPIAGFGIPSQFAPDLVLISLHMSADSLAEANNYPLANHHIKRQATT